MHQIVLKTHAGHSTFKTCETDHTTNMAIMIENRQWIDDYEIDSPHCESEDWDQEILDDPNPPILPEGSKIRLEGWDDKTSIGWTMKGLIELACY